MRAAAGVGAAGKGTGKGKGGSCARRRRRWGSTDERSSCGAACRSSGSSKFSVTNGSSTGGSSTGSSSIRHSSTISSGGSGSGSGGSSSSLLMLVAGSCCCCCCINKLQLLLLAGAAAAGDATADPVIDPLIIPAHDYARAAPDPSLFTRPALSSASLPETGAPPPAPQHGTGTTITALLPALFASVAPPGSTNVPLMIGAITLGITAICALAAFSARETYRYQIRDLGSREAQPLDASEYRALRIRSLTSTAPAAAE